MAPNPRPLNALESPNSHLDAKRKIFGVAHTAAARPSRPAAFLCALGLVAVLSACGGGGGTSAPASVALSGTAATGTPVASATVNIKCSSSAGTVVTGSATTNADGAYTTTVAGASVPCLLQVQLKDVTGTTTGSLHSLASAAGVTNLTPLTNAIVAATLGEADPGSTFAALDATKVSTLKAAITQGKHTAAWTALKTKLAANGVVTSIITGDPITQAFSADAANKGKGYDKVLDDAAVKGLTSEHLYRMAAALPVPPTLATGELNDTGIDGCSENITTPSTWVNNAVCSVVNWLGNGVANLWGQQQDAFFGRDAQAKANTLPKVGGGMAGFDFTKLGADGKPLAVQSGTYSNSGSEAAGTLWDCVRDNVTGLVWEVKRNDANDLRHMGHAYAWYNSDSTTNGGAAGFETPQYDIKGDPVTAPTCASSVDVANPCNTQSYAAAVNAAGLCGKKDWRLPTVEELHNLTHIGRTNPAIDTNYFPNTPIEITWSSSPYPGLSDTALYVDFRLGSDHYDIKHYAYRVRLVRSDQFGMSSAALAVCDTNHTPLTRPDSRYETVANATPTGSEVRDKVTGLIWQRCILGMVWDGTHCVASTPSSPSTFTWTAALEAARLATPSTATTGAATGVAAAWRVPSLAELYSLAERSCSNPAINTTWFPNTPTSNAPTWSSSPVADNALNAWNLSFNAGLDFTGSKTLAYRVRLVRSGQ